MQADTKAKRELQIICAWHTEAFARTKELPNLDTLLRDKREVEDDGSAAADQIRSWAAAWGIQKQTMQ